MKVQKSLLDLAIGEEAYVKNCEQTHFTCKLLTLGLLPKTKVRIVRKAPVGGALYVKINDYQIAVRKEEAKLIFIE
jgi:ferrous iron transport protein A